MPPEFYSQPLYLYTKWFTAQVESYENAGADFLYNEVKQNWSLVAPLQSFPSVMWSLDL